MVIVYLRSDLAVLSKQKCVVFSYNKSIDFGEFVIRLFDMVFWKIEIFAAMNVRTVYLYMVKFEERLILIIYKL